MFDIEKIREQFPILSREINGYPLAYLDNAASAQKPRAVIDALSNQMSTSFANVHRGLHTMANETTEAFEGARGKVAKFLRERLGAVIKFVPVLENGTLDLDAYKTMLSAKTKIVSIVHMSNVLGTLNPVKEMGKWAHAAGATFIVDGTQAAVHHDVDVVDIDCDLFAMTGHKLYGPTGIGALYGKSAIFEKMQPFNGGGEMIEDVFEDRVTYNEAPHKFEDGGLSPCAGWSARY